MAELKHPIREYRTAITSSQPIADALNHESCLLLRSLDPQQADVVRLLSKDLFLPEMVSCLVLTPLRSSDKPIGLLVAGDISSESSCSDDVVSSILQIATHTTAQIDRIRLQAVEERRRWLLQRLDDAAADLRGEWDL